MIVAHSRCCAQRRSLKALAEVAHSRIRVSEVVVAYSRIHHLAVRTYTFTLDSECMNHSFIVTMRVVVRAYVRVSGLQLTYHRQLRPQRFCQTASKMTYSSGEHYSAEYGSFDEQALGSYAPILKHRLQHWRLPTN